MSTRETIERTIARYLRLPEEADDCTDEVLRALDAAGLAVVPKEASAEMLAAAGDAFVDAIYGHVPGDLPGANAPFRRFYRAMIAAAPDVVE